MLQREEVERAIELQARGYQLLRWLENALRDGFIAPEAAHTYATLEDSAHHWIETHYANLPAAARPAREDLSAFSRFFSTYLTSTFDLNEKPGERLYSPDAHCFCPWCSWMVQVPHLTPKKISAADKKVAESMKRRFLRQLALTAGAPTSEEEIDKLLLNPDFREPVALTTYADDLLQRIRGVAVGPATLALWRAFAWTPQGSPKKAFVLSADAVLSAQRSILERLGVRCPTLV